MTEKSPYYYLRQTIMSQTEKELNKQRNKSTSITNILNEDFTIAWDGIDNSIEKWETQSHPFYLAEHMAFHMSRKYCIEQNINFIKDGGKVVDKIMGKEFIEYNKLSKPQAIKLAKERKIKITDDKGEGKNLKVLIADLKANH